VKRSEFLTRGGLALTTCFINPVHGAPHDYWRLTPECLKLLVEKHGRIIDVGGWGSFFVWVYCRFGLRDQPIPYAGWHPANWLAKKNDKNWPIVTWVFAQNTTKNDKDN
jgi:hypothetical protein